MVEGYKWGGLGEAAEWAGGFVKRVGATRRPERTPKSPFEVTLWGSGTTGVGVVWWLCSKEGIAGASLGGLFQEGLRRKL